MSIETQTHASNGNGSAPAADWSEIEEETGGSPLDHPEVIAALAFAAGILVALLFRRRGE